MYTTLLILTFISVIALIFVNSKNILTKVFIIVLGVVVLFFIEPIFKSLSDLFSFSKVLSIKFEQIYLAIKYNDIENVGSRPELIRAAIQNWIKAPLFGMKNTNPSHSLVFELLQSSGFVGLVSWLIVFISSWKKLLAYLKRERVDVTMFNVGMCYVSLLAILNDIRGAYEITIIAFCGIPLLTTFFEEIINGNVVFYRKNSKKKRAKING
jgi:O-antigen ligase